MKSLGEVCKGEVHLSKSQDLQFQSPSVKKVRGEAIQTRIALNTMSNDDISYLGSLRWHWVTLLPSFSRWRDESQ